MGPKIQGVNIWERDVMYYMLGVYITVTVPSGSDFGALPHPSLVMLPGSY